MRKTCKNLYVLHNFGVPALARAIEQNIGKPLQNNMETHLKKQCALEAFFYSFGLLWEAFWVRFGTQIAPRWLPESPKDRPSDAKDSTKSSKETSKIAQEPPKVVPKRSKNEKGKSLKNN